MTQTNSNALSPYSSGSFKELLVICLPLMMVAFSTQFMLFCDRMILTSYSTLAMSSACNAGTLFSAFQMVLLSIAGIAEVFVGQFNGLKRFKLIGIPVWQMIWFSLGICVFLIPIGLSTHHFFIAPAFQFEGSVYFSYLLYFLPLQGIGAALSAFFIGRGHVALITLVTVMGDLLNIVLDIILIFGIDGYVPSMGVQGSAIATNLAQGFIVVVLFFFFFSHKNQKEYGTKKLNYNKTYMMGCLRLGLPSAVAHFIEYLAWTILFIIVSWESDNHAMILAIGQSIFLIFQFMSEGLSKGMTAVVSNLIGRGKKGKTNRSLWSAFYIHLFIMFLVAIPAFLYPAEVSKLFIKNVQYDQFVLMKETIQSSLVWIWIYLFLDGFVWVLMGVLTAGGDTVFILIASALSVWLVVILPAFLIVKYTDCSLSISWKITAFFGFVNLVVYGWRYYSGKWLKLNLSRKTQIKEFVESEVL